MVIVKGDRCPPPGDPGGTEIQKPFKKNGTRFCFTVTTHYVRECRTVGWEMGICARYKGACMRVHACPV